MLYYSRIMVSASDLYNSGADPGISGGGMTWTRKK
jgi:hypothetical protein